MADQQLTVDVSVNAAAAAEQISAVDARLIALEKSFTAGTASAVAHTEAEGAVAGSMGRTAEAATGAGAAMEILDKHVRVVSMGMEAAGLEASSAAVRISALAEVVKTAEGAFAPLLVAMIAFETAMKGAEFFKDAAAQAMAFQAQMETLGASVETQGGNWEKSRADVEAWAAQEAMASGILQAQLIPALNDLVTAGHSLADSQKIVAVAEEVAVAKHMEVRDVVRDLISAEMGRARGLELLDGNVKKVVDSHGKMSDVLKVLHKDYEKSIEDDTSAERANARLRAEIEAVSLKIGTELLPMMRDLSYEFLGGIKNAELLAKGIADSFASIPMAIAGAVTAAKALPDALAAGWAAVKSGNFKGAAGAMGAAAVHDGQAGLAQIRAAQAMSDKGAHETAAELFHGAEAGVAGRHAAGDAVKAHVARLDAKHGLDLQDDPTMGKAKEKKPKAEASPGSMSFTPIDEAAGKTDEYAEAQKKLEAALKRTDDAEKGLAERVKTATTTEGEASAQAAYDAQVTIDLLAKKTLLTDAIRTEKSERDGLNAKQRDSAAEAENARQAYNEYGKEMLAAGTNTIREQNILAELKDHYETAKKAADGFASSVKTLDANIRTNTSSLGEVNSKLDEFKSKAEEAFGAASRAWETYQKKQAEAIKEDLDTANLTNAQKVAYYGASLARMTALDAQYRAQMVVAEAATRAAKSAEEAQDTEENRKRYADAVATEQQITTAFTDNVKAREAADGKYTSSYKAAITDRETAYKAFITSVQGYETTFLDGVLKKHQSLRDSVKDVFNQMLSDWVNHLEAMMLKSSLLKGLTDPNGAFGKMLQSSGVLAAPGGSTGNPQLDAAIAARITGEHAIVQSGTLLSSSHTQVTAASNTLTPALNAVTQAAQGAARALSGVQAGGSGSGGGAFDSVLGGSGGGGIFDGIGTSAADAWATSPNLTDGAMSVSVDAVNGVPLAGGHGVPVEPSAAAGGASALSGAMQGLMIGQLVTGLTGGNSTWGGVGGALGGAFLGPVGAAVGAAIGGLFGPHRTQAQQPDIYNLAWGQADVDFNGAAGAQTFNGQQYTAAAQYNVGDGGTPMYKLMEQWANSAAATTANQKALQAQIVALEGGNPNADFGVVNEKNGVATLADGKTISVTDLIALEQSYTSQVGTGPGSSSLFNLTRTYPDLNISSLQANGTYTPAVNGASTPTNGAPGSTGGSGTVGIGGGQINTNVPNNASGDIVINFQIENETLASKVVPLVAVGLGRRAQSLAPNNPNAWGTPTRYSRI